MNVKWKEMNCEFCKLNGSVVLNWLIGFLKVPFCSEVENIMVLKDRSE